MNTPGNPSADWLERLFNSIDTQDTEGFVGFLAPDATFRFGSAPAAEGREQIATAVGGFFSTIAGCRHQLARTWTGDDSVVVEGDVTYRRHDGSEVTVPFTDVFDMQGELIKAYKIYIDIGPLYAE